MTATAFAPRRKRTERQRTLDEGRVACGRGGWRPGAGRKRDPNRRDPAHRPRPDFASTHPVHVVLRTLPAVGRVRRPDGYQALHRALEVVRERAGFRVIHASLQGNHLHLVCEAADRGALARGVQTVASVFARLFNRRVGRRGQVFEHRYFAKAIASPRQVRRLLAYVLNNWRKHREDYASPEARRLPVDPYSSGPTFDGWREHDELLGLPASYRPLPTVAPTVWLLTTGWRRHRLIGVRERPEGTV